MTQNQRSRPVDQRSTPHSRSVDKALRVSPRRRGVAYLALGVGIFSLSFSAMFVRWANAPGPVTAFYRLFFSIFLLLPFFAPRTKTTPSLRSRAILFPLLAGVFTACDLALWTASLSYTTASNATLLGNTAPLWVALGTWLILKQKLTLAFWRGLTITLCGAALILGTDFIFHPRFGVGDAMAVFTGVFYGGYFLFTEKSRTHFDPISHIWLVGVGASISLLIVNTVLHYPLTGYPLQSWLVFLATAVVSQLIGYMSLAYALGYLPASVVAPTVVLQPIVTTLLAIPLLGEIPTIWQGIGGMIALAGIYIVNQSHQRSTPQSGSLGNQNQIEPATPHA
jgi:drug/metabolite transporter (DMT)-like permease